MIYYKKKGRGQALRYLGEFLSYVLIAVFGQNIVLGKAVGMSEIVTASREQSFLWRLVAVTGVFSAVGVMAMWLLSRFVGNFNTYLIFALLHSLLCAVLYFWSDRILLKLSPEAHDVWSGVLPHAMINSIVIGAPISALSSTIPHWYAALGYGLGVGPGLALAVLLVQNGMDLLDNPAVPQAFRGMPILLIYIGILSLGFCAFL